LRPTSALSTISAACTQTVNERLGGTDLLMNNAGIQPGSAIFGRRNWARVLDVNLGA